MKSQTPKTFSQILDMCPYGADDCPKIEDTKSMIEGIRLDVKSLQRTVYLIAGMIFIEYGIMIL